jgi:hypothetical protein
MGVEVGTPAARRRKLFSLADQLGLDRDERIEFSRALLWRDITSWSNLTPEQVDRLLDALEGYVLVRWLLTNRGATPSGDGSRIGPPPGRR